MPAISAASGPKLTEILMVAPFSFGVFDATPRRASSLSPSGGLKALVLALVLGATPAFAQTGAAGSSYDLLVGTYTTGGKSEGIYVYRFDSASAQATPV